MSHYWKKKDPLNIGNKETLFLLETYFKVEYQVK